ncbi:MAG: LLM class flavin-dependent oxidoreductase [Actinomycetota bacterium]|nr:LLM class flavin-dependent oxidoreductase [Actinomycetota bacterium]
MRVGLALPHYDFSFPPRTLAWESLLEVATWAEGAGFQSGWVSDHYFLDISRYGGPEGPRSCYDPLVTLGGLAPATTSLVLGTLVLAVGFRAPSVVAKAAASLDRLSGGRFELGLGAGWNEPEYRAAGLPYPGPAARLGQLGEAAELVRAMTGADQASFAGRWFRVQDAPNLPPPARRPVPIWMGAKGDRALQVVARHADGWNVVWRWTPDSYRERAAALERACEEVGRPTEVLRSIGLITLMGESRRDLERRFRRWQELAPLGVVDRDLDRFAADRLVGTPDEVMERLAAFHALGVDELILCFSPLPFAWYRESGQELFAERVLPRLRSWPGRLRDAGKET